MRKTSTKLCLPSRFSIVKAGVDLYRKRRLLHNSFRNTQTNLSCLAAWQSPCERLLCHCQAYSSVCGSTTGEGSVSTRARAQSGRCRRLGVAIMRPAVIPSQQLLGLILWFFLPCTSNVHKPVPVSMVVDPGPDPRSRRAAS